MAGEKMRAVGTKERIQWHKSIGGLSGCVSVSTE